MINELLIDYDNVLLVNVDLYPELIDNLNIKCVPTIYIYKEGSLSIKVEGYKNKSCPLLAISPSDSLKGDDTFT